MPKNGLFLNNETSAFIPPPRKQYSSMKAPNLLQNSKQAGHRCALPTKKNISAPSSRHLIAPGGAPNSPCVFTNRGQCPGNLARSILPYGLRQRLDNNIQRLQKVQNFALCVVSGRGKFDHISDVRDDLAWPTARQLCRQCSLSLLHKILQRHFAF